MICWKCKKEISVEKIGRTEECPLCKADLHVCRACEFYESGAHNDCRESSAEYVSDKERGNFCDYYRISKALAQGTGASGASEKDKAKAAKDAFNALFG